MDLLMGRLPANLTFELPIPPNAKVLATLIRRPTYAEVVLDVPQSAEQIQAFYRDRFKAAGWIAAVDVSTLKKPGFVASSEEEIDSSTSNLSFCKGSAGPQIRVSIDPEADAPTDVRLYLDTSAEACAEATSQADVMTEHLTELQQAIPIPVLEIPSGVKVSAAGTIPNSEGENITTTARIETKLSSAALHDAYAQQFTKAGWTKSAVEQGRTGTWSWWNLKNADGQSWKGLLTFAAIEGAPNQYTGVFLLIKQ
jgi:hypothetical protein